MVMIPATLGRADDEDGYVPNREWPPPPVKPRSREQRAITSASEYQRAHTAEMFRELTDRLNEATEEVYVWTPSLINRFVQALRADRQAQRLLADLVAR